MAETGLICCRTLHSALAQWSGMVSSTEYHRSGSPHSEREHVVCKMTTRCGGEPSISPHVGAFAKGPKRLTEVSQKEHPRRTKAGAQTTKHPYPSPSSEEWQSALTRSAPEQSLSDLALESARARSLLDLGGSPLPLLLRSPV